MSLPLGVLSTLVARASFLPPDDIARNRLTVDYELGGVALSDPSQGLLVQVWTADTDGSTVTVSAPLAGATVVTSDTGITEIAFTFDQNMRPTVAYRAGAANKLYWYDTFLGATTTLTLASDITSMRLCHDDKRAQMQGTSDMLLFYIRAGSLRYRQQRDRFLTEYALATLPVGAVYIRRVGMSGGLRLQIEYDLIESGEPASSGFTTAYTDLKTDTMYTVDGTRIIPVFDSTPTTGLWRSKKIVLRDHPPFAWLRVNGPFTYPVTVRIYADGVLWHTAPPISTREPVRLPAGRAKHWELEVESRGDVTSVVMASHTEELL